MDMNKTLMLITVLVAAIIVGVVVWLQRAGDIDIQLPIAPEITNFEECVAAGYPVAESYPRQCITEDATFIEDIGNELEKTDLIIINNPRPNQLVTSPLEISGQARGTWYFEADFPVYLYDAEGNELAVAPATAQGEWMTEDFVPYNTTLTFEIPDTETGELVLEKSNPSGLPEHADELRIPVRFR
jgi:hypothetical protein